MADSLFPQKPRPAPVRRYRDKPSGRPAGPGHQVVSYRDWKAYRKAPPPPLKERPLRGSSDKNLDRRSPQRSDTPAAASSEPACSTTGSSPLPGLAPEAGLRFPSPDLLAFWWYGLPSRPAPARSPGLDSRPGVYLSVSKWEREKLNL